MNCRSLISIAIAGSAVFAQATDGYFDSNGVKIRYVVEGQGTPVLLIHGWMGDSSMWGADSNGNTKLQPAPGFQVIAIDCRGHGKSDKPHDSSKYGVAMALDVVRLLDHLKIKKAHMIGYSMGAFVVGNIAVNHPERLISAIYGGQAPILKGTGSSGSNEVDIFVKAVEDGKGLGPYIIAVSPTDKPKPTLDQANAIANFLYGRKDVKAFALAGQSLGQLAVSPEDLKRCEIPTLFVYGGDESAYVKESVAEARKLLSRSMVKVIAGGTHITTLAKPDFGATIIKFLLAHSRATTWCASIDGDGKFGAISAMTYDEIKAELKSLGNEKWRQIYSKYGEGDDHYGVKMGDLRVLAKKIKPDQDLAAKLWDCGNVDAMLLSTLIVKPKALTLADLEHMVGKITYSHVADWFGSYVLKLHPDREALRTKWMDSNHQWTARMGWSLTAERVVKNPEGLDLKGLLDRLETEMGQAPANVQWTMNYVLAEIGINNTDLRPRAISIGEKIGAFRDYPVSKGCTSPFAPIWIAEMVKRQN